MNLKTTTEERTAWRDHCARVRNVMQPTPHELFIEKALEDLDALEAKLTTPEIKNFVDGVQTEMAHQRERWAAEHDEQKTDADWFWLIGYLAGKALNNSLAWEHRKALHHVITVAAVCGNWHAQMIARATKRIA